MPLSLLLPIVVLGIAGIGILLHLTGHSQPFAIDDDSVALAEWHRHMGDAPVQGIDRAGGAALVLAQGGAGLLRPFGADTVAHRITAIEPVTGGLRLRFAGLGAPPVRLRLGPDEAARWLAHWRAHAGLS